MTVSVLLLPHGAMGCSAVCEWGISSSHLFAFVFVEKAEHFSFSVICITL